ncbi:hypothetical protein M569_10873, partial [Genlisea aurea]
MAEAGLHFNLESVLENLLQQQGKRLSNIDLASRKAQEDSLRRYEAAGWLRKMVGVVAGKDLPAEPSEEHFRMGLRSGIILCIALNKVQPGAVPKVVEGPNGAALSAFEYFENVKNFLLATKEMGIPRFEVSDLEKGGKTSRVVNSVLALRSYHRWKQYGGNGIWKYKGASMMNLLSRSSSSLGTESEENSEDDLAQDSEEVDTSNYLRMLIQELISDKNFEDIPVIMERILSEVMEEVKKGIAGQSVRRLSLQDTSVSFADSPDEEFKIRRLIQDEGLSHKEFQSDVTDDDAPEHQHFIGYHQRLIQELKKMIHSAVQEMKILQIKHLEDVSNLDKHLKCMSQEASRYLSVVEENRRLYNLVQELKGNIRVYCRIRPFLPGQPCRSSAVDDVDETTISVLVPSKYGKPKSFTFNKVFGPSCSQEEVFSDTQPLIRSVLDGYNVCILAYGQTGSGKTYTMTGPDELTAENVGVNYRALSDLFQISEQRKDTVVYDISVQMLEIYNEQVRDLLSPDSLNKRYPFYSTLEIRNNSASGVNVPNASLVTVTSTQAVMNLMNLGHKNRAVGSTAMNDRSSRSHSCLTVHVKGRDLSTGGILRGCMHLVDLAGSERVDKTEATGDRLKEAQHINRSLSALGDVISSLASKNSHVPYRNSKLTQLLQDSLGGQAKTLMFVHISPEVDALGETISTLKFAERVSSVELGAAKANKQGADIKELKEQIASLKSALAGRDEHQGSLATSPSLASLSSLADDTYKIE